MHLGHQSIIKQLIKISKKKNYRSTILSFNPHPREFFSTINEPFNIITSSYKKNLFESLGLDIFPKCGNPVEVLYAHKLNGVSIAKIIGDKHVYFNLDKATPKLADTGTYNNLE